MELFVPHGNPYVGILAFVVAPFFFLFGSAFILVGLWMHRKHAARAAVFVINLARRRDRRLIVGFALGAVAFLLATAFGSYQTYEYTESVQFCGAACHTPMKPEHITYLSSPHARVACVDCHVGSGAGWYIRSKLNGVHQLYTTILGNYHRPIPTPLENLRPARETCEQCHWPNKFIGNVDRTYYHFLMDKTNTPFAVRLLLKVGGGEEASAARGGIHWHMALANKIEYIATDNERQVIPWVRRTDLTTGKVTIYHDPKFHDDPSKYTIRTMDCMDCHNRPAHQFLSPDDAVDKAIAFGRLDRSIPWLKSNVVAVLVQPYQAEDEAVHKIAASLRASYPQQPGIDKVIAETQDIYRNNFFPEMKADWRTYPYNIGHKEWPGCFRCHDGNHKTEDGTKSIAASDCTSCHIILAQGSGAQLKKLNADGFDFVHIDAVYLDFSCTDCHTGAFPK